MNLWTSEEIGRILAELDEMGLPFGKYTLKSPDGSMELLGRGGSANVYAAWRRSDHKPGYALKVIGFFHQNADAVFFDHAVRVQEEIGEHSEQVVRTYDHTEVWILFDEQDRIVSAVKERPEELPRTCLKLQFVLMEKLDPVIGRTRAGNIRMTPPALANGDEKEILKLAYDIGVALRKTHEKKILHRDIKLENVFYSEKKKQYKLGDFGIAKMTTDGFAGTVAFTKGYAAPEVRGTPEHDRYDHTADIYSFGMMLYVLANGLRFPDSNTYNANPGMQYSSGYVLPKPANTGISEKFYRILVKACMYDPDDRYQSMEEMLVDIETLMLGEATGYRKQHKNLYLAVGTILLMTGVVAWNSTIATDRIKSLTFWEYLFLAGSIFKGVSRLTDRRGSKNRYIVLCSMIMLFVGGYLLLSGGFSWLRFFLMLWMALSQGAIPALAAGSVLLARAVSLWQDTQEMGYYIYGNYSWIAIVTISLAFVMMYQYMVLETDDRKMESILNGKGLYWGCVILLYSEVFLLGVADPPRFWMMLQRLFGIGAVSMIRSVDLVKTGGAGLVFCLFWIVRERLLIIYRKKKGPEV